MNIGEALLQALKRNGAREIFGIPGDFVLPFFEVIEQSAILPLFTLSHEPAVGFAADAAARMGARPGVAVVTYGAGALNMVNSVALAYAEKSPLVVISGAPGKHESSSGLLLHHQVKSLDSQMRIYAEITCDQVRLDNPAHAPSQLARVLDSCLTHSQPVYIELPRDMSLQACEPVPATPVRPVDQDSIDACAREILARLKQAQRPVLMVGVGVRRFGLERDVAKLAQRLRIPVVTSFLGRGVLAETGAAVQGTYLGKAGLPDISALVEQSDQLLLLGVILSDTNFGTAGPALDLGRAICVANGYVTWAQRTFPAILLPELVRSLLKLVEPAGECELPRRPPATPPMVADDTPIMPGDIAHAVNDLFARKGCFPVASDVGDCMFTAMDIDHTALVSNAYYASMGFGIPAGLGVQAATGTRALVLVGDGAFQMTGLELGNCQRYGWDPVVIVLNNSGWGMLRAFQPESGFNDLGDWRFADIACALGGHGTRVQTRRELCDALARAFDRRGRFEVIEVMLPRGALSPALTRFVTAVRQLHAPKVAAA